ncbi:MAG: nicotinate phosphoribosyltransferase [Cyanobacteria bacterium J06627_28]
MTFFKTLNNAFNFLAEAIYRIFSPHDDAYPETGVQPYTGYIHTKQARAWY